MEQNMNVFIKIKVAMAALAGSFTAAFGMKGWMVVAWIGCMMMDYITGSMAAAKRGQWASEIAREGIWHKAGMVVVVIVCYIADFVIVTGAPVVGISVPILTDGALLPSALVWYTVTELGSMVENAAVMGAPVPERLKKYLRVAQETLDGGENE